ncbi:alpha/beta fold hydrolase [Sulfitobacter aestuariivivens]|uniref:alpha/beta fold hydrolase n=1 Tax=Sulfitobacter aestuariivivens TaxID=2766981 RepID=UPI00361EE2C3
MHGGGLDHRHMMDALEPVFADRAGWKRVYLDLPGHGRSTVDETVATQDEVFELIRAFAKTVFRDERFAVVGESRGSYHAMAFAHVRPADLRGMMLVVADGMPGATVDWRPEHSTLVCAPEGLAEGVSAEARARFSRLVVQRPEILSKIEKTKVPAAHLVDASLAARIRKNFGFSFDLTAPPAPFEKPALILNGRQDAMAGYKDMMDGIERYPRATFAVLDRAGHSLSWEQPALFRALTQDWLDRMDDDEKPEGR